MIFADFPSDITCCWKLFTLPSPPAGRVHELPFTVEPLTRLDELPLILHAVPKFSGILLVGSTLVDSFVSRDELIFGFNVDKL